MVVNQSRATDKIIIIGYLKDRIGNELPFGVTKRFNEELVNEIGEMLKTFNVVNNMGKNKTFIEHDMEYKSTRQKTRVQQ